MVVGGDQLTRVRLQEAKNLRNIAVTPKRRFEDLNPFVVEMWHNKQDLLEVSIFGFEQQYKIRIIHRSPPTTETIINCWF